MKHNFLALVFFIPCLTYGAAGIDLYADSPASTANWDDSFGMYIDANSQIWFCVKKGELCRSQKGSEETIKTRLTGFDFIRIINESGSPLRLIKPEGNAALRGFYVDQYDQVIAPDGKIVIGSAHVPSPDPEV